MANMYNDPTGGTQSTVGAQLRTDFIQRTALIEMVKEQYFTPLADSTAMPKHFGKTIKRYHYMPMLDDRNSNDQGIDAAGAVIDNTKWEIITDGVASGNYADESAAITAAGTTGATVRQKSGALYGGSKDIGVITSKLPLLGETGGRRNRVGYSRITLEATLTKFGLFDEYTQESLDFDTDAELESHLTRERLRGAGEVTEAVLQSDLIRGAGVIRFGGAATQNSEMTGEGATPSVISYEDLMRMGIDLDDNRCPKDTKVITGSIKTDTKVINAARYLFIGSAMLPTLMRMKDLFDNQAFVAVKHYAAGTTIAKGEVGSIDQFRIIVVPEMQSMDGLGASETVANLGYRTTSGKYDIHPLLCVGSGSFTTIGFQTDGKTTKFRMFHKAPGEATADRTDPYGETGFSSIKWYYASMILRPEYLALAKSVAEI